MVVPTTFRSHRNIFYHRCWLFVNDHLSAILHISPCEWDLSFHFLVYSPAAMQGDSARHLSSWISVSRWWAHEQLGQQDAPSLGTEFGVSGEEPLDMVELVPETGVGPGFGMTSSAPWQWCCTAGQSRGSISSNPGSGQHGPAGYQSTFSRCL